ncbi:FAD-linked oxidoreductase [Periconia macrospinosa]|uniref:Proline dehydrogenase n=1 Tax=Periconia macrospinosa TaxID=97972 RepID=A0A2V1DUY8_9PLEO|nr:FAD-linked oxidoreductase [Periconia macrospinosa]
MPPRIQSLRRLDSVPISQLTRTLAQSGRLVHSSSRQNVSVPSPSPVAAHLLSSSTTSAHTPPKAVLARLPTATVLRSYLIGRMSSSPALLGLCLTVLRKMLESKSYLMSVERNPVLAKLLRSTFYVQYCVGENKKEVQRNTNVVRQLLGYDGIMLEYALEMLEGGASKAPTAEETAREIEVWRQGMLDTIDMSKEGDFVGLKWSGLGREALRLLKSQQDPSPAMLSAIYAACDAAAAKNIALLPGAEEEATNAGLEKWNNMLQAKYNTNGRAVMYTTYQCYLKAIPGRLAADLERAQKGGYTAGVKLVRGAYMASEPRSLIWDTKAETDASYDACTAAVLKKEWNHLVQQPSPTATFPSVNIILATHNLATLQTAQKIRQNQLLSSPPESLPRLAYIQLLGMADEISQQLVQAPGKAADTQARVIKCMTWGTTTQCLNFLLRRASENKEAALRVEDTRRAMGWELWRRMKGVFGLA